MANIVWINGTFVDEAEASVSVRDTGLLHAAGVFTTMRADGGRVFRLDQHLQRLRASCEALFIPMLPKDQVLRDAIAALLARNNLNDARLRLTVTRGHAEQDPVHGMRLTPTIFCTAAALEPYPAELYTKGMTAILLDEQKLNPYDVQAGHKTLNYFSRLAALRSANERGAGEALWFNVHNYLQSGSISNVFVVKDGVLVTPPTAVELRDAVVAEVTPYPKSNVLPGITRGAVMELAREAKLGVKLGGLTVNDLLEADEVFITNSIMLVMPVCRIERKAIGSDKPGPVTKQLMEALKAQM
jgi:branched-chain amino acid aminotransferase